MAPTTSGSTGWRIFGIQLLVLMVLAVFLKLYLPRHQRDLAARAAATREQKITALFKDVVEEDSTREVSVPLDGVIVKRHPQRLRTTFSPEDIESTLGIPTTTTVDFRGGQHMSWVGTAHRLEAAFDSGSLYCLTLEDRSTGHGVMVYKSTGPWHPY
jgi:hypothetical protein